MPKEDTLGAATIQAAKPRTKPYKLFDGGGLYLLVRPDGSRYWRFKYRVDGTEKLISLGVPLGGARIPPDRSPQHREEGHGEGGP